MRMYIGRSAMISRRHVGGILNASKE